MGEEAGKGGEGRERERGGESSGKKELNKKRLCAEFSRAFQWPA